MSVRSFFLSIALTYIWTFYLAVTNAGFKPITDTSNTNNQFMMGCMSATAVTPTPDMKVHHYGHENLSLHPYPVHSRSHNLVPMRSLLNIILLLMARFPMWSLCFKFYIRTIYVLSSSHVCYMICPSQLD